MNIKYTGHHIEVTDALRNITNKKFERIKRHFDKSITSANIIFTVEKLKHIAEITIHVSGAEIHARAESYDMYKAIDLMINKLDRQVIKYKERKLD